jgi:uncharacterized protein YciI
MFLIILKYTQGLEKVDAHVAAHRVYLDKYYALDKFICSGAQNPREGGVILCNADSKEEVKQITEEDPFCINQVAEYDIIEFTPSKYATEFRPFIKSN